MGKEYTVETRRSAGGRCQRGAFPCQRHVGICQRTGDKLLRCNELLITLIDITCGGNQTILVATAGNVLYSYYYKSTAYLDTDKQSARLCGTIEIARIAELPFVKVALKTVENILNTCT